MELCFLFLVRMTEEGSEKMKKATVVSWARRSAKYWIVARWPLCGGLKEPG